MKGLNTHAVGGRAALAYCGIFYNFGSPELNLSSNFIGAGSEHDHNFIERGTRFKLMNRPTDKSRSLKRKKLLWLTQASGSSSRQNESRYNLIHDPFSIR